MPNLGDHLKVSRTFYYHHGIYVGEGQVIEYAGDLKHKGDAPIREISLAEFSCADAVEVIEYARSLPADVVVQRARQRLGERDYSLVFNNCEHFARWCKTGEHESQQVVDAAAAGAGASGAAATTAGAIGLVSAGGAVAGLSGAGVMSGLAATGAAVGGGAVAGLAAFATAPAAVATVAMRHVLRDDEALATSEREARSVGRAATVVGACAGTAGAVATVSAAGSVAGLSAAGITSGLAAVGGTVGGGMVAGVAVTVAAPAAAAAVVGYGFYRAWKWLSD